MAATNAEGRVPGLLEALDYTPGRLDQTAPAFIWLQVDSGDAFGDRSIEWPGSEDVTWQDESVGGLEIAYVRADLVESNATSAASDDREEMSPDFTDSARAALAWVLWHHQGGSSPIGQPIRFALGMDAHSPLHDWHIREAKDLAERLGWSTADFKRAREASSVALPDDGLFYIQDSRSYVGNCPLWWAPKGNGYVTRIDRAGRYTLAEAMAQHRSRDTDVPWPCAEIDALVRGTVDVQEMRPVSQQSAAFADAPVAPAREVGRG